MTTRDYTTLAEAMFKRVADRHALDYEVEADPPIDILWTFPEQAKLSMPITLGLQNGDELNLGVSDFWSYFFPFDEVAERFETTIDAWIEGKARVAVVGLGGRMLQVRDGDSWETVYRANVWPLPFLRKPRSFLINQP